MVPLNKITQIWGSVHKSNMFDDSHYEITRSIKHIDQICSVFLQEESAAQSALYCNVIIYSTLTWLTVRCCKNHLKVLRTHLKARTHLTQHVTSVNLYKSCCKLLFSFVLFCLSNVFFLQFKRTKSGRTKNVHCAAFRILEILRPYFWFVFFWEGAASVCAALQSQRRERFY